MGEQETDPVALLEDPYKEDRAFSLLHQELPQILVLCFP